MKKATLEILLKVADLLDQIPEGDHFMDRIIPDDDLTAQTNYTLGHLMRQYRVFEKDPIMRRIYGSLLRADLILAMEEVVWRQRSQWRDWFMAVYHVNRWWSPDTIGHGGQRFRPADPRNWFPLGEPQTGD